MTQPTRALATIDVGASKLTGIVALQTSQLPDIRQLVPPEVARAARGVALKVNVDDQVQLLEFGTQVTLSDLAKQIASKVKIGDTRGSPVDELLTDLQVVRAKADPTKVLHPSLKQAVAAIFSLKSVVQAYVDDHATLLAKLDELEQRMTRMGTEERTTVVEMSGLREDTFRLYDDLTQVEIALIYLLQRMVNEYGKRQAELRPEDLQAAARLSDLNDAIGMIDRRVFEVHFARARCIQTADQIKLMSKGSNELFAMFRTELATSLPLLRIQMVSFVKILQSKKNLEALARYREAKNKQSQAMQDAAADLAIGVAQLSESTANEIDQFVAQFEKYTATLDKIGQIHTEGAAKRAEVVQKLDGVMEQMRQLNAKAPANTKLVAPADLADAPLVLEK